MKYAFTKSCKTIHMPLISSSLIKKLKPITCLTLINLMLCIQWYLQYKAISFTSYSYAIYWCKSVRQSDSPWNIQSICVEFAELTKSNKHISISVNHKIDNKFCGETLSRCGEYFTNSQFFPSKICDVCIVAASHTCAINFMVLYLGTLLRTCIIFTPNADK